MLNEFVMVEPKERAMVEILWRKSAEYGFRLNDEANEANEANEDDSSCEYLEWGNQ